MMVMNRDPSREGINGWFDKPFNATTTTTTTTTRTARKTQTEICTSNLQRCCVFHLPSGQPVNHPPRTPFWSRRSLSKVTCAAMHNQTPLMTTSSTRQRIRSVPTRHRFHRTTCMTRSPEIIASLDLNSICSTSRPRRSGEVSKKTILAHWREATCSHTPNWRQDLSPPVQGSSTKVGPRELPMVRGNCASEAATPTDVRTFGGTLKSMS